MKKQIATSKKGEKSLVSSVDRVSQDYKSPQGRSVPTIKRAWPFYCNLISDGSKGQVQCVPRKKNLDYSLKTIQFPLAIEVQIIGVKAILGLDYIFIAVCYSPCS